MINDLVVENVHSWKYVDDTTISETVAKGELSNAQRYTDKVMQRSLENRVQLNTEMCKEMRISFTKSQQEFEPILINGDTLEVVEKHTLRHFGPLLWSKINRELRSAPTISTFNLNKTLHKSVHWVACDTCYTKTEGTELGGIELQRSSYFFKWGVIKTI